MLDVVGDLPDNIFENDVAGLLLEAAFDLLAKGGWGQFSLRAVAESIGAAGSAASHRFGDRAGLVSALCRAAVEREQRQMDQFMPGLSVRTDQQLGDVLYEWLEQRVRWNRKQARACSELLLVSLRDAACRRFSRDWMTVCGRMIARLHPALDQEAADRLAAVLAVEVAYWLLLADDPLFRLSSAEWLRRTVSLARGSQGAPPVFWLEQGLALAPAPPPPALTGTKQRIVQATARIILESGVQAVTHREIAKRSGASLSSLTYHFASLGDLIRQGFQALFPPSAEAAPTSAAWALAGYELVLQALRDPFLAPLAAAHRRRMGGGASADHDPGAAADAEMAAMLRTAMILAGEGSQPSAQAGTAG
jgi:AcrR family transcriptional regulator